MSPRSSHLVAFAALVACTALVRPAYAQNQSDTDSSKAKPAAPATGVTGGLTTLATTTALPNVRPADQSGLTVFEPKKMAAAPFSGISLTWGAAFTQDFQNLSHSNSSTPVLVNNVNSNQLIGIGPGFNTAMANLTLSAQLARGIRVDMTTYLSTRHHTDTWVKGGYLQIDASPWDVPALNTVMDHLTLRVGQFEANYGDAHFRRTDAGNGLQNPFVGNLIMDAFTTEIGGDATYHAGPFMAMAGITGGTSAGQVQKPGQHQPAYLGKLGFDKELSKDLRVRLTGSTYNDAKSTSNVLYSGDRGGSHYFDVMGNTASTESAQAWSGSIQPGFSNNVESYTVNPFVKFRGLEVFGNIETSTGKAATESKDRTWRQNSVDVVYRFLPGEKAYVATRFNTANGEIVGGTEDVNVQRSQFAFGLFVTKNVLAKAEYVNQLYSHYAPTSIFNNAKFRGLMFEGAVSF